jgi:hypothetical protein
VYGEPATVGDYVWQAHLATADQHRAMFEAVNHRLWDITSGFTQWKINSAWPDVQWQIFDWFLKPMVSYYYIKRASQPVHIQLGLLEPAVTVVNHTFEPRSGLRARARVFDPSMRVLFEKQEGVEAAANAYRDVFDLQMPAELPPVYFVRLDLTDAAGKRVADNLYWLPAKKGQSLQALRELPPVKLDTTCNVESRGPEKVARVRVVNPTDRLAFFVQLALTRGRGGAEILPVLWDDNYFSLMPGESREIAARFAAADVGETEPVLEVGGWNVEGEVRCDRLTVPSGEVQAGEAVTVTAAIAGTFLDGSRVALRVDGAPAAYQWAWARSGKAQELTFEIRPDKPGTHRLRVGER